MITKTERCHKCGKYGSMQVYVNAAGIPVRKCRYCGAEREDNSWYFYISQEQYREMLYSLIDDYAKPIGLFILKDNDVFVGIDNSSGDMWVEEFYRLSDCLRWLAGEEIESDYDKLLNEGVFLRTALPITDNS